MNPSEKTCFKCGKTLPLAEFYRHKQMADGHLNKCKQCTRSDVSNHRSENIDSIRAYDRQRGSLPHRVAARAQYAKTEAFAQSHRKACRRYSELHPDRRQAQLKLGKAVCAGKVTKFPCFICGSETVEAHHPDYSAPLDVVWLCETHHKQLHHQPRTPKQ